MDASFVIKDIKPSVNPVSGLTYLELTVQILKSSFRDFIDKIHRNEEIYKFFIHETSKAKVDYLAKNKQVLDLMAEELSHQSDLSFDEAAIRLLDIEFWLNDEDIQLFDYTYI